MRAALRPLFLVLAAGLLPAGPAAGEAAPDPLAPLPPSEWTLAHAAHLLRRAGFGGTPEEIAALHALGPDGAVESLLDFAGKPDPGMPPAPITLTARPARDEMRGLTPEQRQALGREWRRKDQLQFAAVREWWVRVMCTTAHPLRERMVLFWHGHFTSGYRDVRNSYHMYMQNTLFRRYATGSFRELLHQVSRDPAMLEYLDNNRNRKAHPNENYAREVMELFALGEGNYTEQDIREGARALTGWTFAGNHFFFDARQHDDGPKTIFGRTGNFDGAGFLDLILDHPACPRHLARKLFAYFAHPFPDEAVVEGLARTLKGADYRVEPVLRQLLRSRAFYSEHAMGTKVKGPVELFVMLHRSLGLDGRMARGYSFLAQELGQSLLDPPNVKGWPGGREWITTSTLLTRYNLAGALVGLPQDRARAGRSDRAARMIQRLQRMRRVDPNGEEDDGMDMGSMEGDREAARPDRRRGGREGPRPVYDVVGAVQRLGLDSPERIVDYYCTALLANPPAPETRAALLEYLAQDGGLDLRRPYLAREKLHGLLRLIVSTPEFQLS